ncbi:hypothetical protein [Promicromonospora soli]
MLMIAIALNNADEACPALAIQTDAGRLYGFWRGVQPVVAGERVDVELELARPRRWAELLDSQSTSQTTTAGGEFLRGTVAAAFEDGVAVIQIGEAAIQVEMLGAGPGEDLGREVVLTGDDLEFYPTGA